MSKEIKDQLTNLQTKLDAANAGKNHRNDQQKIERQVFFLSIRIQQKSLVNRVESMNWKNNSSD